MAEINLLPEGLGPDPAVLHFSQRLKRMVVLEFVLLLVLLVVVVSSYVVVSNRLNQSKERQVDLKASIGALEKTEQKLILLQDRIDKAKHVLGVESAGEQVDMTKLLNDQLPDRVRLTSVRILPNRTEAVFSIENSSVLSILLDQVVNSDNYKTLDLRSIEYRPGEGFELSMIIYPG